MRSHVARTVLSGQQMQGYLQEGQHVKVMLYFLFLRRLIYDSLLFDPEHCQEKACTLSTMSMLSSTVSV